METNKGWFIAIEGNIGSGKSTLANSLSKDWGAALVLEQFEDNSFLPKFYQDPERYAFPLEMSFLAGRFNQLIEKLPQGDLFYPSHVADYSILKSLIFARITLNDDEYRLHLRMFEIIDAQIRKPDLIVYLHRPVEVLLENIRKRGRSYELEIDDDYLNRIQEGYLEYFKSIPDQPVLILEMGSIDFENNALQYGAVKELISRGYGPGIYKIRL
ncbi:MAG: deoxynucleoside kinase [Bacteroidetes bacterium]|nr:deoxynucleoside kinase [Bacteroidota bacterium]